jgi:hypothetical protein
MLAHVVQPFLYDAKDGKLDGLRKTSQIVVQINSNGYICELAPVVGMGLERCAYSQVVYGRWAQVAADAAKRFV